MVLSWEISAIEAGEHSAAFKDITYVCLPQQQGGAERKGLEKCNESQRAHIIRCCTSLKS